MFEGRVVWVGGWVTGRVEEEEKKGKERKKKIKEKKGKEREGKEEEEKKGEERKGRRLFIHRSCSVQR